MLENETDQQTEIIRLHKIITALMNRIESSANVQGTEFNLFQTTLMLEEQVRVRTADLAAALLENEKITHALRLSEARYRAVAEQSLVGITIIEDGRYSYVNACFADIFGYSAVEIQQLTPFDIVVPDERNRIAELIGKRLAGELDRVRYRLQCRRKNGKRLEIEVYGNTLEVSGKRVLVNIIQDITERSHAEQEIPALQARLQEQSIRDVLTGLYNRRHLEEALSHELQLAERLQYSVSLILCDLDHFKQVNDQHGHQAGDEVLRCFAKLLGKYSRSSDINCRYGGEEFLMIMPRCSSMMLQNGQSCCAVSLPQRLSDVPPYGFR